MNSNETTESALALVSRVQDYKAYGLSKLTPRIISHIQKVKARGQ